MSAGRLRPDCLIIGAPKAGTTSLFSILAGHPQVSASTQKEARFFSNDDRFERGLAWYEAEYFSSAAADAMRLEASPTYLTWSEKVAPRIRQSHRDDGVRLIAILRDPVTRAYSHYWHRVRLGHESLPFEQAIAREEERLQTHWDELSRTGNGKFGYVRASSYASRLRPFLEHFDRSRFCFLLQDDLRPQRLARTMKQLLLFLGLDDAVSLEPATLNVPTEPVHAGLARVYRSMKQTPLKYLYKQLIPAGVREKVVGALFRPTTYPPMNPATERALRDRLASEVVECQAIIGRDLSHWLPR